MTLTTLDGTAISDFAFGTMQWGAGADVNDAAAMYADCRAAGINHFDTAHVYADGASEEILGRLMAQEREQVLIATKANYDGGASAANIDSSLDDSRRRLQSDVIDIYYMHRWDGDTPLEETFDAFARHVQSGTIRYVALSNYAAWQVVKAAQVARDRGLTIAMIQPMYNLLKRQAEVEILPMAKAEGIVVCPYSPLAGGLLTGKYAAGASGRFATSDMYQKRYDVAWMHDAAVALRDLATELGQDPATLAAAWVAQHPARPKPILSARKPEQLAPSLAAIDFTMDEALYARLSALTPTPPPATDRLEET